MKSFISLCMIVKDEEKVIERCLQSVQHIVDEIIVVDTGSVDNTIDIVKRYTDSIHHFEWTNNFADARNFAASKANGQYILVLDADEFVYSDNLKEVIEVIKSDELEVDAYEVTIYNFLGRGGEQVAQHHSLRVYKNNSTIEFTRSIHEQLDKKCGDMRYRSLDLIIYHSGYLNKVVKEKNKNHRNTPLVKKELGLKDNAFDYFNLGNEYFSANEIELALDAFKKAYMKKSQFELSWVGITIIQIINCLTQLKRYRDALDVINDAEKVWNTTVDFKCLKANIYFNQYRFDDAKIEMLDLINNKEKYNHCIFNVNFKDLHPHEMLASIYYYEENFKDAVYHCVTALNYNKLNYQVITQLISIFLKNESEDNIVAMVEKLNWTNEEQILTHVINVSLSKGRHQLSKKLLDSVADGNIAKKGLKFKYHILNGDIQRASDLAASKLLAEVTAGNFRTKVDLFDVLLLSLLPGQEKLLKTIRTIVLEDDRKFIDFLVNNESELASDKNYLTILERCIQYNQFELFENLFSLEENFSESTSLEIAHLLHRYNFNEVAFDIYRKIDMENYDNEAFVNIVSQFIANEFDDEAISFCLTAIESEKYDFRIVKNLISLLDKKGLDLEKESFIESALKEYPDSQWLRKSYLTV